MATRVLCGAIALLLFSVPGGSHALRQDKDKAAQSRSIKVKTELLEVRVTVTDRQGRPVENLDRDEFSLLVNNKPRAIDHFSFTRADDQPALPSAGAPDRGAPPSSVRSRIMEPPARTVVLFVDTLHLSISSLEMTKQALRRFVAQRITERDMVALVTSGASLGLAEQFTRDRALLRYAIEKISLGPAAHASFFTPYLAACIQHGDSEALNLGIALVQLEDGISGDRRSMEAIVRGRASQILAEASYFRKTSLFALRELAASLSNLPGQRMIVLFTDGFTLYENGGGLETSEIEAVTSRAVRSGVAIYSIDAKGLQPPAFADARMRGGAAGQRLQSYLSGSESDSQNGMNALAADTGGEMYRNTNDLGAALADAFDSNRSYYVLGFYLEDEAKDRLFRRLSVRIKNHPDFVVRSPKGYYSDSAARPVEEAPTPPQRVSRALLEPLPRTALQISASIDYIEAVDLEGQATLTVRIDGENLQYREEEGRHLVELEVTSMVFNSSGKQVFGASEMVKGSLTPDRFVLAQRNGFRHERRLSLKPGVYQARVGVRETATDRMGTAFSWVEVPNLDRNRFVLSSIILADAPSPGAQPGGTQPDEVIRSRVVQGIRLFPIGGECAYFFRVQKGTKSPTDAPLQVQVELLRQGSVVTVQDWRPLPSTEKDGKGISVPGKFSLAGLPAGIYEMRVSVREPQAKRVIQRMAVFGIDETAAGGKVSTGKGGSP